MTSEETQVQENSVDEQKLKDVYDVLKTCYDPEIPINILDLGLIYDVKISEDGKKVFIKMTLTAPGCPVADYIRVEVQDKLQSLEWVDEADVEIVWTPPWTPDMMSEEARKILGWV